MTLTKTPARTTYNRRVPPDTYEKSWWAVELANLQRAIPSDRMRTETTNTTATVDDGVVLVDATGGARTVTLPDPVRVQFMAVTVKKIDASANPVTLSPSTGTIDGAGTLVLTSQYQRATVQSDGAHWWVTGT